MRPFAIALAILGLAASDSFAGFIIKQIIPGSIVLPTSRSSVESVRGAEMDGDTSSGEAVIGWQCGQFTQCLGIVHLASGSVEEVAMPPYHSFNALADIWLFSPRLPDYADADGDGLLDVLVVVSTGNYDWKTLVIGWGVGAALNDPPANTATPPNELRTAPNPTGAEARLDFTVPAPGRVSVSLFDVSGRMVRELLEADLPAGGVSLAWDGRDDRGELVPAGVFFSRIEFPGGALSGRIVRN